MLPLHTSAKILIVDDNPSNTDFLSRLLQASGYQRILICNDSYQALPLFREHAPDLMLLDIDMPQLDGYQVMELIRRELPDSDYLPVIVLTAHTEQEHKIRALQAGAQDYVHKPIDSLEVLLRINNFLTVRMLQNELRESNYKLESRVQERTRQLRDAQRELISRLGKAAEYRDKDTGSHIYRMSRYCSLLGKAAGYTDDMAEDLEIASTLHDIGKIGIPDNVLKKPGALTAEERMTMEGHTTVGANILKGSSQRLIQMAESIASAHHEKWDGTGYPKGLKGTEIPESARICAICDVFDALTSSRPYKNAWTTQEAVAKMQKGSGTHFDPELLDLFFSILPEIEEVRLANID